MKTSRKLVTNLFYSSSNNWFMKSWKAAVILNTSKVSHFYSWRRHLALRRLFCSCTLSEWQLMLAYRKVQGAVKLDPFQEKQDLINWWQWKCLFLMTALSLPKSTQKGEMQPFFPTNSIGELHSLFNCWIISKSNALDSELVQAQPGWSCMAVAWLMRWLKCQCCAQLIGQTQFVVNLCKIGSKIVNTLLHYVFLFVFCTLRSPGMLPWFRVRQRWTEHLSWL